MGKIGVRLTMAVAAMAAGLCAQPVEIVIATYGAGQLHDVTGAVRSAIASGKRELPVTLEALGVGDPAPGRVKALRIIYRAGGGLYEAVAQDFENIALPVSAPAEAASTQAPATTVQPTTGGFFDTPGTASSTPAASQAQGSAEPAASAATNTPVTISPVASVPNGACFYVQANYGGTPYCFSAGAATATLGSQRRRFRSVRLVGSAQAAVLFDADNFLGASVRLNKSQPDLRTAQGAFYTTDFEDRAASIRVE